MNCPHCLVGVHESWSQLNQTPNDESRQLRVEEMTCPACHRLVARGQMFRRSPGGVWVADGGHWYLYPRTTVRPVSPEVPDPYRSAYAESASAIDYSERASAALSRALIQDLLRDKGQYAQNDLSKQIDAFRADPQNPKRLSDNLHYTREIGNFAAHTQKSVNSGEILPVEPGEAEWCLDVLDDLFEHYFVEPARDAKRRADLDAKIAEAGRKPLS